MKKFFPVVLILLAAVLVVSGCVRSGRGLNVPDAGQTGGQQPDAASPNYDSVDDILNLLGGLDDLESEIDDVDEGDLYIP